MRKIISNSTPLIILGNINRLYILKELYGEIIIPKAVFDELTAKEDKAKQQIIQNLDWIKVLEVQNTENRRMYQSKLHDGEVEVMMLRKKYQQIY